MVFARRSPPTALSKTWRSGCRQLLFQGEFRVLRRPRPQSQVWTRHPDEYPLALRDTYVLSDSVDAKEHQAFFDGGCGSALTREHLSYLFLSFLRTVLYLSVFLTAYSRR